MLVVLDEDRLALKIGYNDRHIAKQLGATWDKRKRLWIIPDNADLSGLKCLFTSEAREHYQKQRQRISKLLSLKDVEIRYADGLADYQQSAVWFLVNAKRAILADEPGLGKTAVAIRAVMEAGVGNVLVVTKKSLIHNWELEIGRWCTNQQIIWTVINYEQLTKHAEQRFDALIVDEAQCIKNRRAKRTKLVHSIAKKIPYVWLLTGTPIVNSPADLWSLLHTVDPKKFSSFWRFIDKHCYTYHNYFGHIEIGNIKDDQEFAREVAPYMLRRTKELLKLPPLSFEDVYVELLPEQKRIYDQLRRELIVYLDENGDDSITATNTLALLTRLRQVTCSPALFGGPDISSKTDTLIELLETYAFNHKVLVFSTFAEYVKLLYPKLKQFNPLIITGESSEKQRRETVEKFKLRPDYRIVLGTIGAMGEGLNLQEADVVIFLNQDWTPAANEQAYSRAYRRGQDKPVHVINIVAHGTVDEHVRDLLRVKDKRISKLDVIKKLREGV